VLKRAALDDMPGLYNVAADGAVYLSQALRLGGRTRIPIAPPLIGAVIGAARFAGITALEPHHLLMLRYGRVIDNARMKTRFGALGYTTREAILDLYGARIASSSATEELSREEQAVAAA
jgi:UDP-glucose 4-epimerase